MNSSDDEIAESTMDDSNVVIEGHIKIFDPETDEEYVNKRDA